MRGRYFVRCLVAGCLLSACAAPTVAPPASTATEIAAANRPTDPAQLDAFYLAAEAQGQHVLRIDAQQSLISVVVHRGGRLARLGHDHVVASRAVAGYVAPQLGRSDFYFPLDQMSVDESGLRNAAGFDTQPSDDAIAGTRHNMLVRVLEAGQFPFALMQAVRERRIDKTLAQADAGPERKSDAKVDGKDDDKHQQFNLAITLHGVTRTLRVPVLVETSGAPGAEQTISASGAFSVHQTDFGLVPFSVLGGAIAVQDQLDLRFKIVAVAAAVSAR